MSMRSPSYALKTFPQSDNPRPLFMEGGDYILYQ